MVYENYHYDSANLALNNAIDEAHTIEHEMVQLKTRLKVIDKIRHHLKSIAHPYETPSTRRKHEARQWVRCGCVRCIKRKLEKRKRQWFRYH